jgi:hypothetical protein
MTSADLQQLLGSQSHHTVSALHLHGLRSAVQCVCVGAVTTVDRVVVLHFKLVALKCKEDASHSYLAVIELCKQAQYSAMQCFKAVLYANAICQDCSTRYDTLCTLYKQLTFLSSLTCGLTSTTCYTTTATSTSSSCGCMAVKSCTQPLPNECMHSLHFRWASSQTSAYSPHWLVCYHYWWRVSLCNTRTIHTTVIHQSM